MSIKKLAGKLHLWLGLSTGLVVFIISITGCFYAFQKEILDATEDFRFSEVKDMEVLPPSAFEEISKDRFPDHHLHAINYPGKGRSVETIYYAFEPVEYYFSVYHDPYTAEIIEVKDHEASFFHWILDGHYYLWLPPEIGQPVTAYSTLIFLIMIISGIILWWPKNKAARKQRFWFKWKASTKWKRKNYDLHNIVGFYTSVFALILATTGIVFGIQWFAYIYYKGLGGSKELNYITPPSSRYEQVAEQTPPIDKVWHKMLSEYPEAVSIEVHTAESDTSAIAANANYKEDMYWSTDYRYFDQNTLAEIPVNHVYGRLKDADAADKLLRMNYDIHVGAILGLPGKIIAFIISLLCASLPVTGFMVWIGKKNKKKRSEVVET